MVLKDLKLSKVSTLILTYLCTKCPSTVLINTDLPPIQRLAQPYVAKAVDHLYIGHLGTFRKISIILGINVKHQKIPALRILWMCVVYSRSIPGKSPCTAIQGVDITASIQVYHRVGTLYK